MDIRKDGWHGRLIVSGIGEPLLFKGNAIQIIADATIAIQKLTPRKDSSGHKEITLQFSTKPLDKSKDQLVSERVSELESLIDFGEVETMTMEELTAQLKRESQQ